MNIYDFDNTIYDGDTGIDIILYSLVRHPFKIIKSCFKSIPLFIKYKKRKIKFELFKESMFSFLFKINNLDNYLNIFVEKHLKKIKPWYYKNQKEDDIVISASYEIWIKKFCNKINIKNVIATKTDKNGKILGNNCKNKEKINRLLLQFPNIDVKDAFSDSMDDLPMFKIAKNSYLVKKDKLIKYDTLN